MQRYRGYRNSELVAKTQFLSLSHRYHTRFNIQVLRLTL